MTQHEAPPTNDLEALAAKLEPLMQAAQEYPGPDGLPCDDRSALLELGFFTRENAPTILTALRTIARDAPQAAEPVACKICNGVCWGHTVDGLTTYHTHPSPAPQAVEPVARSLKEQIAIDKAAVAALTPGQRELYNRELAAIGGNPGIVFPSPSPAPQADAGAKAAVVTVGEGVTITQEMFDFLMGAGPLEGKYFGERNPPRRGSFWWRSVIRESLTRPLPTDDDSAPSDKDAVKHVARLVSLYNGLPMDPLEASQWMREAQAWLAVAALARRAVDATQEGGEDA